MKLRRLTPTGIEQFAVFVVNLKTDPTLAPPERLLCDPLASEAVDGDVDFDLRTFADRYEAAEYLDERLRASSLVNPERDEGLWSWLSLYYFNLLCPRSEGSVRRVKEISRYIPATTNYQRFYRHLLLGPFMIYRAHADNPRRARGVLATSVNAPGDAVEQLASRQELITNRAVMGAATALYVDAGTGRMKSGSGGKGAGSPRRLAEVINQFDLTYDLYALRADELLEILPREFDRFRPT